MRCRRLVDSKDSTVKEKISKSEIQTGYPLRYVALVASIPAQEARETTVTVTRKFREGETFAVGVLNRTPS